MDSGPGDVKKSRVNDWAGYVHQRLSGKIPKIAVILGSGLGGLSAELSDAVTIEMKDIPGYPLPTVEGHEGKLTSGVIKSKDKTRSVPVILVRGRVHFYETGNIHDALSHVHLLKILGIEKLLVTNAAGGLNQHLRAGDLMLIRDQINFTFKSPPFSSPDYKPRPGTPLYDERIAEVIRDIARENKIPVREGVYAGVLGPSYETPAEIRMLKLAGADAVGMSTVPETLQACMSGMRIGGISCITNTVSGIRGQKVTHREVTRNAAAASHKFSQLVKAVLTDKRF